MANAKPNSPEPQKAPAPKKGEPKLKVEIQKGMVRKDW